MKMVKRMVGMVLCLSLALGLLPASALAVESAISSEPKVKNLTVSWDGSEPIELLGELPTVSIPEGAKPVFTVTFDNAERLSHVYVTSTKDGETKYLEAKPQNDGYVTDGYFDPADEAYIPGTVSVEYTKKVDIFDIDEKWDSTWDDWGVAGAIAEKISGGAADDDVTVAISNVLEGVSGPVIEASVSTFEEEAGVSGGVDQLKDWLGYYEDLDQLLHYEFHDTKSDQDYIMYLGYPVAESQNYAMIVKDVTDNRYTKMLVKAIAGNTETVADQISHINTASKLFYDYYEISGESAALQEQIDANATMTAEQKAVAKQKVNSLDQDRKLFAVMTAALPAIMTVAGVAGGPPGLVFSALLGGITATAGMFWEHRIGMIEGCEPIDGAFSGNDSHGIPLTQAYLDAEDSAGNYLHRPLAPGRYYLVEDIEYFLEAYSSYYNNDQDITICLHGHNIRSLDVGGDEVSHVNLHICDCTYREKSDGTVSGGTVGTLEVGSYTNLTVTSGIVGAVYMRAYFNNTTANIAGGKIGGVYNPRSDGGYGYAWGTVNITGGIITGEIDNSGTMNISGGVISHSHLKSDKRCSIITNYSGGTLHITGGTITGDGKNFDYCIENSQGAVSIDGGSIGGSPRFAVIRNSESGTLTIKGGVISSEDAINQNIKNSGEMQLDGGIIRCGVVNTGKLTMRQGTIETAGIKNDGAGEITILGGTITNIYQASAKSTLRVSGGRIGDDISGSSLIVYDGTVTISHGTFIGDIFGGVSAERVIFRIKENSIIEMRAEEYSGGKGYLHVEADENYTGGVRYYHGVNGSAANSSVEHMTLAEAEMAIAEQRRFWSAEYMRLEADGVSDKPKALANSMFTVDTAEVPYAGQPVTKEITGQDGEKTLAKGVDYTVAYRNNDTVGIATITITGKGSYVGTLEYTFSIRTPRVVKTGTLDGISRNINWSCNEVGTVSVSSNTPSGVLPPEEKVLVGCYDDDGRFTGAKWLDAETAAAQIDLSTPNVKLFWLDSTQAPLSPCVTVWGK